MPKRKTLIVKVPSFYGNTITYREGRLIKGTDDCLAVVSVEEGFTVNHVLSGCSIGSNDDNLFPSRKAAVIWAQEFWSLMTPLAVRVYQIESDVQTLRKSATSKAKQFAQARTNRKK